MRSRTALLILFTAALILDSRCAARSAGDALELCLQTLIPSLFPLFVLSNLLIPGLSGLALPRFCRFLGIPVGSGGMFLLGCLGGFPLGALTVGRAVDTGAMTRADGARMMGLCSLCGPAFLFGAVAARFSPADAAVLFLIQLEAALITAAFWPGRSERPMTPAAQSVTVREAVGRAISSMGSVCGWVILAAVAAGFLKRWLFPILPEGVGVVLTGLLELTGGVFALEPGPQAMPLCALFVCFGGVSVLLQISAAGLPMWACICQKWAHGLIGLAMAMGFERFGPVMLLPIPLVLAAKIAVEISETMVYNSPRKEGI